MCPTYLWAWTWKGIVLAGVIIVGYGNSKYLLLDLLWLFPVSMKDDRTEKLEAQDDGHLRLEQPFNDMEES